MGSWPATREELIAAQETLALAAPERWRPGPAPLARYRTHAYLGIEFVNSYLPPPQLRLFKWLSPDRAQLAA